MMFIIPLEAAHDGVFQRWGMGTALGMERAGMGMGMGMGIIGCGITTTNTLHALDEIKDGQIETTKQSRQSLHVYRISQTLPTR